MITGNPHTMNTDNRPSQIAKPPARPTRIFITREQNAFNRLAYELAESLTDEDVRDLGAYFATLAPPAVSTVEDPDPAMIARGREIVTLRHCSACHTDTFEGKLAAPRLALQREEVIVKALTDYRTGVRPSIGLAAMTEAAAGLDDADISAVAHFLATFK